MIRAIPADDTQLCPEDARLAAARNNTLPTIEEGNTPPHASDRAQYRRLMSWRMIRSSFTISRDAFECLAGSVLYFSPAAELCFTPSNHAMYYVGRYQAASRASMRRVLCVAGAYGLHYMRRSIDTFSMA